MVCNTACDNHWTMVHLLDEPDPRRQLHKLRNGAYIHFCHDTSAVNFHRFLPDV